MGGELPDLDDWTKRLLTNPDLLEMDNHIMEKYQLYRDKTVVVWKATSPKHVYYGIFNVSDSGLKLSSKEIAHFGIQFEGQLVWEIR